MRNILFLISFSEHKLFTQDFLILRDIYQNTIKEYNLPIKVIGYRGGADSVKLDTSNDILYIPVSDTDIAMKYFIAHKCINENPQLLGDFRYDVVVVTNPSSVVNLHLLNRMVQDSHFDMKGVYGNVINCNWHGITRYPEGKVMIYSKEVRDLMLNVWEGCMEEPNNVVDSEKDYYWTTCDDFIVGKCCLKLHIPIYNIPKDVKFILRDLPGYPYSADFSHITDYSNIRELASTLFMSLKSAQFASSTAIIRECTEDLFIRLAWLVYSYPLSTQDTQIFLDRLFKEAHS